jgi:hypothetical protein
LATRSGIYSSRIGILIRLETSTGTVSYGEVHRFPGFPTKVLIKSCGFAIVSPKLLTKPPSPQFRPNFPPPNLVLKPLGKD